MLSTLSQNFPSQQEDSIMLRLYDRAMAATSCGIVISDVSRPDIPIIYCNPAFERITGYSREEVLGNNCRFLQGADTDPAAVAQIRTCLREGRECQVTLKNYRKDGTPFWNELTISPVRDASDRVTHYIGVQTDITERKEAEEAQRLMQFSLDRAGDAAFWMTSDARFFYVNEAACRSLGYSRQELLQLTVHDIDPDFPKATWLQPWEAIKQQDHFTIESRYQTKDGRIFPVEMTVNYLEFNGQEYYCAFAREITERKQSEAALKESATRLRLALSAASMGVWDWDLETNCMNWSEEVPSPLGIDTNSSNGESEAYLNYVHPDDREGVQETIAQVLETGCDFAMEHRVLRSDGSIGWIAGRGAVWRDRTDKIVRMLGTAMDITERKQSEAALTRSEELYRTLAKNFPNGTVLLFDRNYRYLIADGNGLATSGLSKELLEGKTLQEVFDPTICETFEPLYQAALAGKPTYFEYSHGNRTYAIHLLPVTNEQGEITAGMVMTQDITKQSMELAERVAAETALRQSEAQLKQQAARLETALDELKQTQAQLIQSEKMSSLGQLVAGVAHEINNPVNFITGNLIYASEYAQDLLHLLQLYRSHLPRPVPEIQAAIEELDLDFLIQDFPKLLNSMHVGADRIRQIVLSLRNFCRLDEAECKPVDLHEGLDNTLLILQHRLKPQGQNPGIQLLKEYGDLPSVECYAGQLNQVFMNLLNNAIDALEESSKFSGLSSEFEAPTQSTPTIRIHTEILDGDRVAIRIADNGTGIPEAIQQRIFDPFFTTKPVGQGTGLGLSISYQIVVEKHRGQLRCSSNSEQGTEFIVEIPLQQAILEPPPILAISPD